MALQLKIDDELNTALKDMATDKESLAHDEAELEGLSEKALGATGLTNEDVDNTLKCYKVTPKEISDLALLKFVEFYNAEDGNMVGHKGGKIYINLAYQDGRIRYYEAEKGAKTPGPTRGASFVTEYNPKMGTTRQWMESYDQKGKVSRVHPKSQNGQALNSQHYPPTGKELGK